MIVLYCVFIDCTYRYRIIRYTKTLYTSHKGAKQKNTKKYKYDKNNYYQNKDWITHGKIKGELETGKSIQKEA